MLALKLFKLEMRHQGYRPYELRFRRVHATDSDMRWPGPRHSIVGPQAGSRAAAGGFRPEPLKRHGLERRGGKSARVRAAGAIISCCPTPRRIVAARRRMPPPGGPAGAGQDGARASGSGVRSSQLGIMQA